MSIAELATESGPVEEYASHDEWLLGRGRGIGASDVATILHLNPWKSPYTLYYEKRGELPAVESTIPMQLGHYLEPFIDRLYQEETHRTTVDLGDYTVVSHPDFPWLRCTPDRVVLDESPQRLVELKSIGEHAAKSLGEDGDIKHQVQVQIQMACLGMEQGDIAALVAGRDFRIFPVARHDRFLAVAIAKCQEFWERLQAGDPPMPDDSESTAATIAALHPDDNGETVVLSPESVEAAQRLDDYKAARSELDKKIRGEQNLIKAAIGDATYGQGPGWRLSLKTQERKEHMVKASKYRVLRKEKGQS
jgi:putative phage-type endonuclease